MLLRCFELLLYCTWYIEAEGDRGGRKKAVGILLRYTFFSSAEILMGVVCSYLLVCFYNMASGSGFISLYRFIYPFFSQVYSVEGLYAPLETVFREYWIHVVVYVGLIWWAVTGLRQDSVLLAVLGVSGLTSLVYFMNRAMAGNISLVRIQLVIALGMIVEAGLEGAGSGVGYGLRQILKDAEPALAWSLGLAGYIMLFYFAADAFLMTGGSLLVKSQTEYDTEVYKDIVMLDTIKLLPEEKTVAVGIGAPEIFYMFGLDTNCHIGDYSDPMTEECMNFLYDRIAASDYLFLMLDRRWDGIEKIALQQFEEIQNTGYAALYRRIGVSE